MNKEVCVCVCIYTQAFLPTYTDVDTQHKEETNSICWQPFRLPTPQFPLCPKFLTNCCSFLWHQEEIQTTQAPGLTQGP